MDKINELTDEEKQIITAYRRVKERRHGDLELSIVNGTLVKVWEVVKHDLHKMRLQEAKV